VSAFRIVEPSPHQDLPDVRAFLDLLARGPLPSLAGGPPLFAGAEELVVTRAPGRLDLMGGFADYSGSLVLEWPLREAALVAMGLRRDRLLRLVSLPEREGQPVRTAEVSLDLLGPGVSYDAARQLFAQQPDRQWAAYVAGAFVVLGRERGLYPPVGADLLVSSSVPEGKGVSSSAAVEVAAMRAVMVAHGWSLPPVDLALLCQKVENLVAGAACGVMDQMTAACGERDRLLALLCQPAELHEPVPLPEGVVLWGLDSGVRHAVSGSDYTSVRVGAFIGYRIVADLAGLPVTRVVGAERVHVEDARWRGYLANLTPAEWEGFAPRVPEHLEGGSFLERYGGTSDPVTRVEHGRLYAVRVPTTHPVHEHVRVGRFAELLRSGPPATSLPQLGQLMERSHASYSACGLGATATDDLAARLRQAGWRRGLHGAKITGGGSGGTVAVLGEPRGLEAVEEIAAAHALETGHPARVFSGSSPGACAFGCLRVRLD
jgi:L-arabinokinase